jgi:hypothetical protein
MVRCPRSPSKDLTEYCLALILAPLPALMTGLLYGAPRAGLLLSAIPVTLGAVGLRFVIPWLDGPPRLSQAIVRRTAPRRRSNAVRLDCGLGAICSRVSL